MTELDAAALDFARECLGWPDVDVFPVDYRKRVVRNLAVPGDCWTVFCASDMNTVMDRVREWCDANERNLEMYYVPAPTALWHVSAGVPDPVEHADLRVAAMAACVEVSRKLKDSGA